MRTVMLLLLAMDPVELAVADMLPCTASIHRQEPAGSAFAVREHMLLTNAHVVGADEHVQVKLHGKLIPGDVILLDRDRDLALIRVEAKMRPVRFGQKPRLGQQVIAIGMPFGLEESVSTGIISGFNRKVWLHTGARHTAAYQTTTPINPGNSGGPLFTLSGEVVGVVFAARLDANNLAFAIPVDSVREFLNNVK